RGHAAHRPHAHCRRKDTRRQRMAGVPHHLRSAQPAGSLRGRPARVRARARLLCHAGAPRQPARDHDRANHHGRRNPAARLADLGAMLRIDRTIIAAAKIHGASAWQAFRTIFVPLSLPGVYGAGLLVFVLALGFYVTPALLGSPRETMIAQTIMVDATQLLDWP